MLQNSLYFLVTKHFKVLLKRKIWELGIKPTVLYANIISCSLNKNRAEIYGQHVFKSQVFSSLKAILQVQAR